MSPAAKHATTIELVPLGHTAEPAVIDVALVADPLPRLEQIHRSRRRWQIFALSMTAAFIVVSTIGFVQYGNMLVACKLLRDARDHADQAKTDTERVLAENRKIYDKVIEDRRDTTQLANQLDVTLRQLGEQQANTLAHMEGDPRFKPLIDALRSEMKDAIGLIRREGEDQAAFLQLLADENFLGPPINRLVPVKPKMDDE